MSEQNQTGISFTTRDRVLMAWENSMELVRDYKAYASEVQDDREASKMFAEFAEDEGNHAAKFYELLREYEQNCNCK